MLKRFVHTIESSRAKYVVLPRALQMIILLLAVLSGLVGTVTLIPLPELGIPILLLAVGILSFEFEWARLLLKKMIRLFESKVVKTTVTIIGISFGAIAILLWMNHRF